MILYTIALKSVSSDTIVINSASAFIRIEKNAASFDTELWKAATMFVKTGTELRRTVANIKKMNAELRTLNFKKLNQSLQIL